MRVIRLEYRDRAAPRWVQARRVWMTTGFLPPELREEMHLTWTAADARGFERFTAHSAAAVRLSPGWLRAWPFRGALRDVRVRLAQGTPLFDG